MLCAKREPRMIPGKPLGVFQLFKRALFQMPQHVRRVFDRDALQFGASRLAATQRPGEEDLAVKIRSDTDYMRKPAKLGIELPPVGDAIARFFFQNHHVGRGAEQTALKSIAKSIVDGDADHQRRHAGRDACHRNPGDDRDHGLLAFGAQVAAGDEKLEGLGGHRFMNEDAAAGTG